MLRDIPVAFSHRQLPANLEPMGTAAEGESKWDFPARTPARAYKLAKTIWPP